MILIKISKFFEISFRKIAKSRGHAFYLKFRLLIVTSLDFILFGFGLSGDHSLLTVAILSVIVNGSAAL